VERGGGGGMTGEAAVRAALNEIIDPCSRAAGEPAGLVDMGLVRRVEVQGARVEVTLALTEPTCLMGFPFVRSARERLSALPGVEQVDVSLDPSFEWTPADLSPAYAARLARRRASRARTYSAATAASQPPGSCCASGPASSAQSN
jgi:metal-sulfur cluster biosynthetic enzyme